MRLFFGGATYFCHLSWRCDFFLPSFFGDATFFVIFNFVLENFVIFFEATTFFAIFGNKLYPRREKFWPQVCENSELKVGSSWGENGEIQTKNWCTAKNRVLDL